jgi:hypothetical protein
MLASGVHVTFYETKKPTGEAVKTFLDAGKNPPGGVMVTYYLKEKPKEEIKLTFLDVRGQEIKTFSSEGPEEELKVPAEPGANRFVWDLRYPDAHKVPGDATTERSLRGPVAPPGSYQVRLTVGSRTYTQPFEVRKDQRISATQKDLEAQFQLLLKIRDKLSDTHDAINNIRGIKKQAVEWVERVRGDHGGGDASPLAKTAKGLEEKLSAVEEELIQSRAKVPLDSVNFPSRLNVKVAALTSVVASADTRPTQQSYEVFSELSARIDSQLHRLKEITDTDLTTLNRMIREMELPAVVPQA